MTLTVQFYTMLSMIAMGSFFGASLDTYQRFLKRGSRKRMLVFFNDILFWVIHGLITFYVLFLVNYGELRFYLILCLLCGFSAYQALMKNVYNKILERVISFCKSAAVVIQKLFLAIIYRPIKGIILALFTLVMFLAKVLFTLVKFIWSVLLWVLKVVTYPLLLIGRWIYSLLPKSFKKQIEKTRNFLAGLLKTTKKHFIKVKNLILKK
ncbi:spore cortex biosynthesis protein YabQ [Lederbergia graminis]|uniref:Spore cortex biosynthesis protein YabQ n=1 Tax=Lederbergia graminis TaxID=735518 RepID=A0ABW0LGG9_9BACI|nr:spore cortex biosynthesis protein YabQ [Paenibacillus bovis]